MEEKRQEEKKKEERYRLVKRLSEGGTGTIWLVWDTRLCKYWVKKEMPLEDDFMREGVLREITALKKIKHEGIPMLVDVFWEEKKVCLILEYMEGETLSDFCKKKGRLTEKEALKMLERMTELVEYLHAGQEKIIHGDIKPSNFIWNKERLSLLDFGTASGGQGSKEEAIMGTLCYAPPERTKEREADERWDIYSLGACLFFLVTGEEPGDFSEGLPPVREQNPMISPACEKIIQKCTAKKPEERYQSTEALRLALKRMEKEKKAGWIRGFIKPVPFYFFREKKILLTEKKVWRGILFIMLPVLFLTLAKTDKSAAGSRWVKTMSDPVSMLPVTLCKKNGEKLLVAYDSAYNPKESPVFEIPLSCFEKGEAYEVTIFQVHKTSGAKKQRTFLICAK